MVSPVFFFFIMFCSWNVRGAGKKGFSRIINDVRRLNHIDVFAILEPRISGVKAVKVIDKLGFYNRFIVK